MIFTISGLLAIFSPFLDSFSSTECRKIAISHSSNVMRLLHDSDLYRLEIRESEFGNVFGPRTRFFDLRWSFVSYTGIGLYHTNTFCLAFSPLQNLI